MYQEIDGVKVWGEPLDNAVAQAVTCSKTADQVVLMADHHLGYSLPIGGVVAYRDHISPNAVGYDIACGNKAVRFNIVGPMKNIKVTMDTLWDDLSFGMGVPNKHVELAAKAFEPLEDDPAWDIPEIGKLKDRARSQLGSIGSGNHYVDLFVDDKYEHIWCGVHFGSRSLGHKTTTHFLNILNATAEMNSPPALLRVDIPTGKEYLAAMALAGRYAYAGRDWVCSRVGYLLGAEIIDEVHNHHNFAWRETHDEVEYWIIRKGATPAWPGQKGFIGGSMGDNSVIIEAGDGAESKATMYSTIHGAGRVLGRMQAKGKWKRGKCIRPGQVSQEMMDVWVNKVGVELRGAGVDESPHCYKRLADVLPYHSETIKVIHTLRPVGVAMASERG